MSEPIVKLVGTIKKAKLNSINEELIIFDAVLEYEYDEGVLTLKDKLAPIVKNSLTIRKECKNNYNSYDLGKNPKLLALMFFLKTKLGRIIYFDYEQLLSQLDISIVLMALECAKKTFGFRPNEQLIEKLRSKTKNLKEIIRIKRLKGE